MPPLPPPPPPDNSVVSIDQHMSPPRTRPRFWYRGRKQHFCIASTPVRLPSFATHVLTYLSYRRRNHISFTENMNNSSVKYRLCVECTAFPRCLVICCIYTYMCVDLDRSRERSRSPYYSHNNLLVTLFIRSFCVAVLCVCTALADGVKYGNRMYEPQGLVCRTIHRVM